MGESAYRFFRAIPHQDVHGTDAHLKLAEIFEMTQTTSSKNIAILRYRFACYGLPEQIISDNGPQFTSAEITEFLKEEWCCSVPYYPSSNGAEIVVRTFKESIKAGEK